MCQVGMSDKGGPPNELPDSVYTQAIKDFFHWSAIWQVRNGMTVAFWIDNWGGQKITGFFACTHRLPHSKISLRDPIPIVPTLLPQPQTAAVTQATQEIMQMSLSDEQDRLWRWGNSGEYSAKVPPTERIFGYLFMCRDMFSHIMLCIEETWRAHCRASCAETALLTLHSIFSFSVRMLLRSGIY